MGRDTGFILRTPDVFVKDEDYGDGRLGDTFVPNYAANCINERSYKSDTPHEVNEYEVCYWRKIHSMADFVDELVGYDFRKIMSDDCTDDDIYKDVSLSNLDAIIDEMLNTIKYPENFGSGVWTYEEYLHNFARQISTLSWVREYLESHPKAYLVFYDSI